MNVDFLNTSYERQARRTTALIAVFFTIFVGVLSSIGAAASYRSTTKGTNVFGEINNLPVISNIRQLVLGENALAERPTQAPDGRINVMLFGVGGAGHDGAELTDTIILGSLDTQQGRASMLSLPRDMAYPLGGGRFEKINAVNVYAELEHPGQGANIAAQSIGKLLGVRVDHVVKVDFQGFEKFVDTLGGVDINVERSFIDPQYPTLDDLWQTVSFKKGPEHMTGARALMYVRSRHGTNGEGSDFARNRRQQLVLEAVRDKLLSLGTLANPVKIGELWNVVSSHIQTDLSVWDLAKFAPFLSTIDHSKIASHVLTDGPNGELVAARVDGLGYTEFPRKPDWSEIRDIAQNPFQTAEEKAAAEQPKETIHLEIKNGTTRTGFASQLSTVLQKKGYLITATGNAHERGYERSVIFDITGGKKPEELARLKKILDANVSSVTPAWLQDPTQPHIVYSEGLIAEPLQSTSTDFLIILGESSIGLIDPYVSQTTP